VLLLKEDRSVDHTISTNFDFEREDAFRSIRCPVCSWRPLSSSRWTCICYGTPEPYFEACGTIWNTFATRGRCPGCSHQWQWTSCLRCEQASLHVDWYEGDEEP
jgi:hypothetical protein